MYVFKIQLSQTIRKIMRLRSDQLYDNPYHWSGLSRDNDQKYYCDTTRADIWRRI